MKGKQNTYNHSRGIVLTLAKLESSYSSKHHLNIFKRCFINPVSFNDHCLVSIGILPLLF